jgi:hypothetical protein
VGSGGDEAAIAAMSGVIIVVALIFALVMLGIWIFVCYLLSKCFERVPPEFRKQEPGMVWLLLIPCFNIIWNFFVYPRLAESYQGYFASVGQSDVGDCGRGIGMGYCICAACSLIPYIGALAGLASLVLLIMFLVKANELKNRIATG